MSIFLPSLVKVPGNGSQILHYGDGLDLAIARVEYPRAVSMKLTHGTECLCITYTHGYVCIGHYFPENVHVHSHSSAVTGTLVPPQASHCTLSCLQS